MQTLNKRIAETILRATFTDGSNAIQKGDMMEKAVSDSALTKSPG